VWFGDAGLSCRRPIPRIEIYRTKAIALWAIAERSENPEDRRLLIEAAERCEFAAERLEAQLRQARLPPLALG
jgi:hypothetical protein